MSFDEGFLVELVEALAQAKLQVIFIGNAAAILHGVPVMTQDADLMVCEHPHLQKKLQKFADIFKVSLLKPYEPFSEIIRAVGRPVSVDFVLNLSNGKSFESVRSRAIKVRLGRRMAWVAGLEDIIAAKEAAGREKDKATLPDSQERPASQEGDAVRKKRRERLI